MSEEYLYHDADRGEEIARRKAAADRRLKEREGQRFWERCLADPAGRKEIWRLLTDLNAFRTEFPSSPAGVPDDAAVWFKHGRSTFGFDFFQYLTVCSRDGVRLLQDEHDPRFTPEPFDEPKAQMEDE